MRRPCGEGGIFLLFLPIRREGFPFLTARWPKPHSAANFKISLDMGVTANGVAMSFLEAVAADPDDAWAFVSRHYSGNLDLEALRDVLDTGRLCKWVVKAPYMNDPKNCMTRSVLVLDTERKIKRLLHLRLIKEPDQYGSWKVYGVEQE
jgi:hypothetical protein